jgi:protein phosphatase 2C family protein 2/3
LNIVQPSSTAQDPNACEWPKCAFFGLYDGHGGPRCADFLRDNLHKFVSRF